jgi:hypothetical protein
MRVARRISLGARCRWSLRDPTSRNAVESAERPHMRLMLLLWTSIIGGGLAYFIVIGLTHH